VPASPSRIEFMAMLSLTGKRILAGIALLQLLFCVANYYAFHLFDPFDKKVLVVSGVILGIYVKWFGPTVDELRDYREKKRSSTS
jgi:hypothetical protein